MTQTLWSESRDHHITAAEACLEQGDPAATAHALLAEVYQSRIVNEGECHCPLGFKFHANNCPEFPGIEMDRTK